MRAAPIFILAAAIAMAMPAHGTVRKRSLNLADLPAAVRKTVQEQKQQGTILHIENSSLAEDQVYAVEIKNDASKRTVYVSDAGAILEVRENIALSKVAPAARKSIESSVGNGTILTLQSVKSASGIIAAYAVKFKKNGAQSELRISPDGRLAPE